MEINNLNINSSSPKAKQAETSSAGKEKSQDITSQPSAGETVFISSESKAMNDLESSIKEQPDFDTDKVAQIKAAIAEGNFAIDDEALANNIIQFEELFS
ncbi:flagellar biosynthesis anti-sigma factor FlgM [Litoribacillus peritrichatus]|uniref:Negative regulator of flagellin synthesis n=1 Tax=Litoribacillus peritrichatus TaxID=718191 RepID=A0ABP7M3L3_9GAMM